MIYIARPIQRYGLADVEVTDVDLATVGTEYAGRSVRWTWWYGFAVGAVVVACVWFVSLNP